MLDDRTAFCSATEVASHSRMSRSAIVLACDDKFVAYTACVARRISRHLSKDIPILVLSDGVSDENKTLAGALCDRISFVECSGMFPADQLPVSGNFTRATYMRLFLDDILDLDRIVYIDSDITVLSDLVPLLELDMTAPIAAAYDLGFISGAPPYPYFNGGVAVYDLPACRDARLFKKALRFAIDHPDQCPMVDQDALNHVLNGHWQILDWRWNLHGPMSWRAHDKPFIRHFTGYKPWGPVKAGIERRYVDQWRADLADSPWKDRFVEEPFNLSRRVRTATARLEDSLRAALHSRSSGRRGDKARFATRFNLLLDEMRLQSEMKRTADMCRPQDVLAVQGK